VIRALCSKILFPIVFQFPVALKAVGSPGSHEGRQNLGGSCRMFRSGFVTRALILCLICSLPSDQDSREWRVDDCRPGRSWIPQWSIWNSKVSEIGRHAARDFDLRDAVGDERLGLAPGTRVLTG
jgi:hypothetical protein